MKTILVTGASGYIGTKVVSELVNRKANVIALDRNAALEINGCQHVKADIFDPCFNVRDALGFVPDACLHLAWRNGFVHNDPSHLIDLPHHYRFLTELEKAGVRQIAVMGTMHEVGYWEGAITADTPCNPKSLYGIAKNALRQSLEASFANKSVVFQWLRAFYIYGNDEKSQSIFGKLIRAAKAGDSLFPFTSGKNMYDFIEVGALAQQIASVISQDDISGIINCCSGEPESLAHRVEAFIRENNLAIALDYGAFPDRDYDSPGVWGDSSAISSILATANDYA